MAAVSWTLRCWRISISAGVDYALFSAGGAGQRARMPRAPAPAGAIVIDNTSEFRYEDDVPLVVPEVNGAHA